VIGEAAGIPAEVEYRGILEFKDEQIRCVDVVRSCSAYRYSLQQQV
jgi:hypothetical protein